MLKDLPIENPMRGENALLRFNKTGFLNFDNAHVEISYIPDRDILEQDILTKWLVETEVKHKNSQPENVVAEMMNTFYNELLPYYVSMEVKISHNNGVIQRVQTVKQQPSYRMPNELKEIL